MYFIDLDKLKIRKEFHYQTYAVEMNADFNLAAAKMLTYVQEGCKSLFTDQPAIAASYVIDFNNEAVTEEDFYSLVNITTTAFFKEFTLTGGRKREHRLDIPENLAPAHIAASVLKRAVNTITYTDVFNLTIKCGQYTYYLVDAKEIKEDEVNE